MNLHRSLAQALPDIPRWVEARDLLLHEQGEIFGVQEAPELSFVIRDPVSDLTIVVGTPSADAVREAVQQSTQDAELIAPWEQASRLAAILPEWSCSRAGLYLLPDFSRLPAAPGGTVGFLDPDALQRLVLPDELGRELYIGATHSLITATFVGNQPVSFCYAGAVTETLWDISIDTVEEHRRHGYAALCAAYMIRHMHALGKQPVWGAVEENPASWRLAQKLGFVQVDELVLFARS